LLHSDEIYNGRLLHVFSDEVRLPNSSTTTREWIKHRGAAAVLPVFNDGSVMLIKQFRYPVGQTLHEVPAGKIDDGENPEQAAVRELKEETGLLCDNIHYLAPFYPTIGYSSEIIHLFCAWNLTETDQRVDDEEFLKLNRTPFHKTIEMVYSGDITDGKSMINILLAQHWWQQNGPFGIDDL